MPAPAVQDSRHADRLPLIGRHRELQHLTVAAGFNGNGCSWALAAGDIVAGLLADETPEIDLAPFDPGRFEGVNVSWNTPFTAGEGAVATPTGALPCDA